MTRNRDGMNRRDFLSTTTAIGASAVLAPAALAQDAAATGIPQTVLGKTGESVTTLSAGPAMPVNPRLTEDRTSVG